MDRQGTVQSGSWGHPVDCSPRRLPTSRPGNPLVVWVPVKCVVALENGVAIQKANLYGRRRCMLRVGRSLSTDKSPRRWRSATARVCYAAALHRFGGLKCEVDEFSIVYARPGGGGAKTGTRFVLRCCDCHNWTMNPTSVAGNFLGSTASQTFMPRFIWTPWSGHSVPSSQCQWRWKRSRNSPTMRRTLWIRRSPRRLSRRQS